MKTKVEVAVEQRYLQQKRNRTYIMLEDEEFNWYWDEKEVEEFDYFFNQGLNVFDLAHKFNRPEEEIAVMMIDRGRKGKLKRGELHASAV
ncbi:MAG: hypothetical protein ACI35R_13190 [Bacillus sp. (in: firmicutes)]